MILCVVPSSCDLWQQCYASFAVWFIEHDKGDAATLLCRTTTPSGVDYSMPWRLWSVINSIKFIKMMYFRSVCTATLRGDAGGDAGGERDWVSWSSGAHLSEQQLLIPYVHFYRFFAMKHFPEVSPKVFMLYLSNGILTRSIRSILVYGKKITISFHLSLPFLNDIEECFQQSD